MSSLQMALKSILSFLVIFIIIQSGKCERTKDKMYLSIGGVYCFRRLTATQQHGCSSSFGGDTGVIHFIDSAQDVDWIIKNGEAGPYVPVVSLKDFKRTSMINLKNSGKVSGILLYRNGSDQLASYSTDDSCPNRKSGLDSEACDAGEAWNVAGNSLFFEDWGFPIAFVDDPSTVSKLYDCFLKYNSDVSDQSSRPLCAVHLLSHMLAAVDSRTCIRRSNMINNINPVRYCDALGDYSVYSFSRPLATMAERSVIVLAARQDGASMFDGLAPGAMSPITSLVTLLTTAKYLKTMGVYDNDSPTGMSVLLMLFNGEAFDYIGSSKIVYDILNGTFPSKEKPLSLDQIGLFVELDQIAGDKLFYHSHSTSKPLVKSFIEGMKEISPGTGKLPPSSLQRFLKGDPEIPGIVISNYNTSYKNPYYNSIADDANLLKYIYGNGSSTPANEIQGKIDNVAMNVARMLYKLINGDPYTESLESNIVLVDDLLHCYLETQNCTSFRDVADSKEPRFYNLLDSPAPVYVGVHGNNNTITQLTALTLAFLTGTNVPLNKTECTQMITPGFRNYWMNIQKCYQASVDFHVAVSPAFEIEGYDWTSNAFSSWTESIWRELDMKMFLKPSFKHEVLNVTTGLLVLIVSFVAVYFVNAKADILFNRAVLRLAEGGM